jgi:hypothetical protein
MGSNCLTVFTLLKHVSLKNFGIQLPDTEESVYLVSPDLI